MNKTQCVGIKVIKVVWFALLLCLATVVGCGQQQRNKGYDIDERALSLVGDVSAQIIRLYPPAKTRFVVSIEPDESNLFGLGLVGKLREAGYAVHERKHNDDKQRGKEKLLTYLVDEYDSQVRVLIHLGDDSLSRMYDVEEQSGNFVPAGGWAWRRGGGR